MIATVLISSNCSNSARTQGLQKTNMPSTERSSDHFIYSTPALSVLFFSIFKRSVLMALFFYHRDILEKVTMQRTQQFSAFSLLNASHAQLLEKLRPIAFAETCRFLTIQLLEFREIWQKK